MDNRINQKLEEKQFLALFRKSYEDFPKGKIYASESPDFIVKLGKKKSIGIEITRFILSSKVVHQQFIDNLNEIIDKKNEKFLLYQKKVCNNYWLIIFVEDLRKFVNFSIQNIIEKLDFNSNFDKIFLFDMQSSKTYFLKDE
ncbi:MAG: hypothetical protein JXL97_04405 [Bacteroidales bacterium]|nr:hypothetical protein [Bacteroidales bacterium]